MMIAIWISSEPQNESSIKSDAHRMKVSLFIAALKIVLFTSCVTVCQLGNGPQYFYQTKKFYF